ncbi:MAG: hypothetical protein EHM53_05235 [Methanoregulaceae archaeon]|nr:MAG: hypothetical protein EHM53_05235 [Methanoregulaceae archaeon]
METGDILTVAGGLFIVLIIALIANPQYLTGLQASLPGGTPVPTRTPLPLPTTTAVQATAQTLTISLTPAPPYRIPYTDNPFSYPVIRLPDRVDTLGESDIRRSDQDIVTFAFVEDSRGGLTRVFSVPYPVWSMDIRVVDNTTPNIASFRMALCYAANGTIIDGVELIHPGTAYKKIQTSNTPLYLIISTAGIEQYHISLQTSRQYYDQFRPQTSGTTGL